MSDSLDRAIADAIAECYADGIAARIEARKYHSMMNETRTVVENETIDLYADAPYIIGEDN